MSEKDYLSVLDSLEIKYAVEKDYSSTVSEGEVVSTSKDPGEKINIKEGEVLTVVVSKGPYQPPITTTTTPSPATTLPEETDEPSSQSVEEDSSNFEQNFEE